MSKRSPLEYDEDYYDDDETTDIDGDSSVSEDEPNERTDAYSSGSEDEHKERTDAYSSGSEDEHKERADACDVSDLSISSVHANHYVQERGTDRVYVAVSNPNTAPVKSVPLATCANEWVLTAPVRPADQKQRQCHLALSVFCGRKRSQGLFRIAQFVKLDVGFIASAAFKGNLELAKHMCDGMGIDMYHVVIRARKLDGGKLPPSLLLPIRMFLQSTWNKYNLGKIRIDAFWTHCKDGAFRCRATTKHRFTNYWARK